MALAVLATARQGLDPASALLPASDCSAEAGVGLLALHCQARPVQLKLPLPEPCQALEAVAYCDLLTLEQQSLR